MCLTQCPLLDYTCISECILTPCHLFKRMVEHRLKSNYDKMASYNGKFKLSNIKHIASLLCISYFVYYLKCFIFYDLNVVHLLFIIIYNVTYIIFYNVIKHSLYIWIIINFGPKITSNNMYLLLYFCFSMILLISYFLKFNA